MNRDNVETFCLTSNIAAATSQVYPTVGLLDTIRFDTRYLLTGVQLSSACTCGAGASGVFVLVGTSDAEKSISNPLPIVASHVYTRSDSRAVFVDLGEKNGIVIQPSTPISLYGALVATANQQLLAIAILQLIPIP